MSREPRRGTRFGATAFAVVASLLVAACESEEINSPDPGTLGFSAHRADRTAVPVTSTADGSIVGRSTIHRSPRGVQIRLTADNVPPVHAVTVWARIFNDKEVCAGSPCTAGEMAAANGDLVWLTGRVTGRKARFHGTLRVGDGSNSVATGVGLLDPLKAEIHLTVRSHGPPIPGLVQEQISTAGGGCDTFVTPNVPGLRECSDMATAVHTPAH